MKSKSKAAFKHNIEAEMRAGKPQKQALAIAYATKRRSKSKGGMIEHLVRTEPKEYAKGGMVEDEEFDSQHMSGAEDSDEMNDEENREESPFQEEDEHEEDFLASSPDPKPNVSDIIKKIRRRKMEE
jgi:hypothetical protein